MVSLRFLLCFLFVSSAYATIFSHDGRAITIDGHRRVLLSGSIHYPRSTPEMWPDLIKKGKEGGLDAIETYVFWNAHEPTRRQYDFSGKLDLIRFLKTIQDEGLYGVLRIGPYACAEWNYGGFPVWLHNMPGMVFRTTNKSFMDEMQNFTTMIVDIVKKEKLFASQGVPIILAQIENEYGNVMGPYGDSGKAYIKWCANMAQSLDVGVPWIMCQQNDAPQPMITTQTSMMVKKPNEAEDTPSTLKWSWRPENVDNFILKGKGESTQTQLFDQKVVTNDQSDYLWYMTTVKFKKRDPFLGKNMSLRVNSTAHVLHAFVNGKHIGNQHAEDGKFNYVFEKDVKFKSGRNVIALLSITVGLANYGIFFESKPAGITGPIFITGRNGDETIVKDLSAHKWSYKTGLNGFDNQLFRTEAMSKWSVENVPFNRTMTWYKATFKAPLGNDPVVVDLMGLGKGTAWVNGNNIGRYWPAFISSENGCDAKRNYRGAYHAEKCLTNCGEPTQRWYHVPRSFLNAEGDNTLVLFEEMGGNPSLVSFQTTRVGSVCANVYENKIIELSCDRKPISAIKFASFGNPHGNCGSFEKGTCESSNNTVDIITQECVGKEKCSIDVSTKKFGAPDCSGAARKLAVEVIC
uniref:beta-galactosidase n=1 Tax=Brassica campestris TaxID=3711 RepID=M4DXF2_BRACM